MLKSRVIFAYRFLSNLLSAGIALVFLLLPGLIVVRDLADPALRRPGVPDKAWRMHRYLTPRIEKTIGQRDP